MLRPAKACMLNQCLDRDIGSELIGTNVNAFPRRPWDFHPNKRLGNTDHPVSLNRYWTR